MAPTRVLFSIIIFIFGSAVVEANADWYYCHGDYCNVNGAKQYCSEIHLRCVSCLEIVHDCFTKEMPENCTSTCKDIMVETLRAVPCPTLVDVVHGSHNQSKFSNSQPGDVVSFSCDSRYKLDGPQELTCMSFGQWSRLPPKCVEITCAPPYKVLNGAWSTGPKSNFSLGQTIDFHCLQDFTLVGSAVWTCKESGWVGSAGDNDNVPVCNKPNGVIGYIAAIICTLVFAILESIALCATCYKLRKKNNRRREDIAKDEKPLLDAPDPKPNDLTVSLGEAKRRHPPCTANIVTTEKEIQKEVFSQRGEEQNKNQTSNSDNRAHRGGDVGRNQHVQQLGPSDSSQSVSVVLNVLNINENHQNNINNAGNATTNTTLEARGPTEDRNSQRSDDDDEASSGDEETIPQQPTDSLPHPTMETQSGEHPAMETQPDETDLKSLANNIEGAEGGEIPPLAVQSPGNNEQDLSPKMALPNGNIQIGDLDGSTTAPDGNIPLQKVIPSGCRSGTSCVMGGS